MGGPVRAVEDRGWDAGWDAGWGPSGGAWDLRRGLRREDGGVPRARCG